jgi:hypothetical protein
MPNFKLPSTQDNLEVEDVLNNLIVLKDGSCAMVLQTNAINFGLLSEEEQDATIYAYAAFLNSLTFTVQVLIRSETKDISNYLHLLENQEIKEANESKKHQINSYKQFVRSLVTERNVLEKKFYIVIPYSSTELGGAQSFSPLPASKKQLPFEKTYILEKAKANLEPRRDHVMRQLGRIGLAAKPLNTQELIQLLFTMYNPSSHGIKLAETRDYTVPLVQPAYSGVTTPPPPAAPQPVSQVSTPAAAPSPEIPKPQEIVFSAPTPVAPVPPITAPTPTPLQSIPSVPPPQFIPSPIAGVTLTPPVSAPTPPINPPQVSTTIFSSTVAPTPPITPPQVSAPTPPAPPTPTPPQPKPSKTEFIDPQAAINVAVSALSQTK